MLDVHSCLGQDDTLKAQLRLSNQWSRVAVLAIVNTSTKAACGC